jgi:hypothetical protein
VPKLWTRFAMAPISVVAQDPHPLRLARIARIALVALRNNDDRGTPPGLLVQRFGR